MANKKVSQLTSKPSVLSTDIVPIADPSTGQLFKTTLSALGAVIGSAVASVNGLIGVVVLDTDDIQELASPTNRWYTDTRSRAALSGGTGISYNSGTGVITSSVTLASLGGVPTSRTLTINGTTLDLSADRSFTINSMVYPGAGIAVSTGSAWATSITDNSANWNTAFSWGNHAGLYLPIGGGTLTGNLNGTTASFSGTISANHSTSGNYGAFFYNGSTTGDGLAIRGGSTSSQNALIVQNYNGSSTLFYVLGNGESAFASNVTANSFVKTGGTSSGFLKADGSVDVRSFATTGNLADYLPLTGGALLNNPSSAYVLTITNNSTASGANGLNVSIATGSAGNPFKVDKGGVTLFNVDNLGAALLKSTITAISFIKSSGTSSEFLKADGSVDSNTYVSSSALSAYLPLTGGTLTGALEISYATPLLKLQASSSASFHGIEFRQAAGFDAFIKQLPSTGEFRISNGREAGWGGFTTFYTDTSEKMRITSAGNVGIGTTAPSSLLHLYTSTARNIPTLGNAGGHQIIQTGGVIATCIGVNANGNYWIQPQHINPGDSTVYSILLAPSGGNVGIGTTSPNQSLEVFGSSAGVLRLSSTSYAYNLFTNNSDGNFYIRDVNNGVNRFIITSGGNVGINVSSASYRLQVDGNVYFKGASSGSGDFALVVQNSSSTNWLLIRNDGVATFGSSVTAGSSITATSFFESSDKTIKTLIEDNYQAKGIESVTAKLYLKNGVEELGYFAQDIQAILPSAVSKGSDGLLNLSYREVHTAKIARLEKRVKELETQLNLI